MFFKQKAKSTNTKIYCVDELPGVNNRNLTVEELQQMNW